MLPILDRAGKRSWVEGSKDLISDFEAFGAVANSSDVTCQIGTGDDVVLHGERVLRSRNTEIAVVQGDTPNTDKDLMRPRFRNGLLRYSEIIY